MCSTLVASATNSVKVYFTWGGQKNGKNIGPSVWLEQKWSSIHNPLLCIFFVYTYIYICWNRMIFWGGSISMFRFFWWKKIIALFFGQPLLYVARTQLTPIFEGQPSKTKPLFNQNKGPHVGSIGCYRIKYRTILVVFDQRNPAEKKTSTSTSWEVLLKQHNWCGSTSIKK